MRALALFLLLSAANLYAQSVCSPAAESPVLQALHLAQAKALRVQLPPMDSGVPASAIPTLLAFRQALVTAADTLVACQSTAASAPNLTQHLQTQLHAAAPGSSAPAPGGDSNKPIAGTLGNDISIHATLLSIHPRLLGLELSSTVPCGSDSQLLVYEAQGDHWQRRLRWSTVLALDTNQNISSGLAGDFFLTTIVPGSTSADAWHAVIAHGTPWCTSRFSTFGLSVLAPSPTNPDGHLLWHTERSYSRGDFQPRLKSSPDTFELRLNADAMSFDETAFERTAIYRYRVSPAGVTRIQPMALNARTFVEEWLSSPSEEARAQQQDTGSEPLRQVHDLAQQSAREDQFTSWQEGPVRACGAAHRFQVAFDSQRQHIVSGEPGGGSDPPAHHYFQLYGIADGYQLLSVSAQPDPACTSPDLMERASPATHAKPH